MKRIHVVGTGPRTGTTLMAEAMIACFDIDHHTDHETRIFSPPPEDGKTYLTKAPQDLLVARPSDASVDALRGVRPIALTSVGRWRDHLPRVAGQLQIHGSISDDLAELGYEQDDAWLELLEDVEPDTSPSHWPEHFTDEEIRERRQGIWKEIVKICMRRLGLDPPELRSRLPV